MCGRYLQKLCSFISLNLKMLMEGMLQTEPGRLPKLSGRLALCRRVDGGIFRLLITPRNNPTYLKTGQTQLRLKVAAPYKNPTSLEPLRRVGWRILPNPFKAGSKGSLMHDPEARVPGAEKLCVNHL